jgi:hypothetical protein
VLVGRKLTPEHDQEVAPVSVDVGHPSTQPPQLSAQPPKHASGCGRWVRKCHRGREQAGCLCSRRWPDHAASGGQPREMVPSGAVAREADDSTSSYARRRPALPEGLEWRVDGLVPAGLTADVNVGRSVLGAESAGCIRPGSDHTPYGDSRTLGCDYVQQHIELQPLICSALLHSQDPVVGGLCMHILGLSLE